MGRNLILFSFLFTAFLTLSVPIASEIFTDSGLMDIPTGEVLKHGIFGVGVYAPFQNTTYFKRYPVAFRVNFGMFDRIELGASHILPQDNDASRSFLGHVKAQLLNETGKIPNIAIGIDNLGDNVGQKWDTYHANSAYLVISKTFNLPRIHLISGHIGVGNHRFAFDERPIGLFAGVSTELHPAFARGDIALSLEFDGKGANAGLRYTADSGLQIALGVETLNKPEDMRYLVSVSWTNAQMLEQIDAAKRLARQAAKLANQAKRTPSKQEETSEQ